MARFPQIASSVVYVVNGVAFPAIVIGVHRPGDAASPLDLFVITQTSAYHVYSVGVTPTGEMGQWCWPNPEEAVAVPVQAAVEAPADEALPFAVVALDGTLMARFLSIRLAEDFAGRYYGYTVLPPE